ncbi:PREDICTED: cytoplasmic dynein 2 heavy chain 1 [Nicrophorus vespilloides]|uniref:Cytoplasmic dynein 2 heavy chain 1 n=1 Tax=Nicrophorus vespilloides TaxID=110193 RepID=A0ABM1N8F5_NICVS|nr:PREDICTED: cytoplasmic dynein 2 heavy chain 1 [Nicrophorus vespilloides]
MCDFRKKLLINLACSHLGFQITEDTWEKDISNINILEDFLDNERNFIVCANLEFLLTDQNLLQSLCITSFQGSLRAALYHSLDRVFSPLIHSNLKQSVNSSNIEKHISSLQADLRCSLSDFTEDPLKNVDGNSLSVILSVNHEVEYWHNVCNSSKNRIEKTSGSSFLEILKPLARDLSILEALPISDVENVLESAHNILDDLWRNEPPYPRIRIEHLMELISSDLIGYIVKQFAEINIWETEFNEANELLDQCIGLGNAWHSTCKELTEIFWPNYSLHQWKGPPFQSESLAKLVNRLKDIVNIKTVHKQLTRLLSETERNDLNTDGMFKPFLNLNIMQCGDYTQHSWDTASKQFEYMLKPAEERVANKLKKQLKAMESNTRQLMREFDRYSELIARPVLKSTLQNERQLLLSLLQDYIKNLSMKMTETPLLSTKYETPQVVAEIIGTRQLESKANHILTITNNLLDDLYGFEELKQYTSDLIRDLKAQNNELFESWTSEIVAQIRDKSLSLCETDPVVQFTTNKLMKVNYAPRLVGLISEVRQLSALGYNIPEIITKTSEHAKQFIKFAKYLEQIANFHNTIGDKMIPSQRPMMLISAVELSRLVQNQEVVSWGDIEAVEKYVETLKTAVDKLSTENDLLTSYHFQVLDKIDALNSVDLLKYYDKWKLAAKHMRDLVSQVQAKGFMSLQNWKVDLDKKLCTVLEKEYEKSLNTVHLYLPEIYAELVYRGNKLAFVPDEKTLKDKYDQQMKRFLEIPRTFRGISDNPEHFSKILEKCQEKLNQVSSNTDKLFEQLEGVKQHWSSWLSLGVLDSSQLITSQHWDLHFRSSKTFGQEIAKLPSTEERVGCFIIGLSRLRSDLESHNRSYWDQLVVTLKDSIVQNVLKLQQYVDTSTATLNRQPLTLDQIGEADASHSNILTERPEMTKIYQEMIQKAENLASWTRERIDSVKRLQAAWERLESLLENYQHIIAKQVDNIKSSLNVANENLNGEMERFAAKWEQVKPRPNSGQIASESLTQLNTHLANIKEKKGQWAQIEDQRNKLIEDYKRFNMEIPMFEIGEEIQNDLEREEKVWELFEEFYSKLESLSNEEWIVFRKKTYKFEDFLTEWQSKLESQENTALVTRILQEIHKFQDAVPVLKYLKGEDFTDKHWIEAFSILGIPSKPLDMLTLKDFLENPSDLAIKQTELQVLCKKAASEIIVRQALAELEQWDVQARFQLAPHLDSHGKEILLIKDFKEILNRIGDNQSLLQSVKNSADYESFSERANAWENRLADLDQYLTSLAQIQRKWVYLEPIFGSGTLGQEKARFDKLERDFRNVLKFIENDSRVCALCRYPNLRAVFENLADQLGRCQKSLEDFLTEKRNRFPRFLFLGDDDLLEVIGQSSKEHVIQSHLKKLFSGIHGITLDSDGKNIITMKSLQGENVVLSTPVNINQPVEDWLNTLVKEMQRTLKNLLVSCLGEGKSPDPLKYPSQILCLTDSINFTSKCEQAIASSSLSQLSLTYKNQLNFYSSLDLNENVDNVDDSLGSNDDSNVLELKLKALLLDTIHHLSVIDDLKDNNVTNIKDWDWQKQLRFYSNTEGDVIIKMVNAKMEYAFEYIGNTQKLVRTPLTDQCFLTLTQAMYLGMGGNPYGPAGTGKTESVKALGSLLGRQVLVFNCDEGIDTASMGRILSGLVRSGAWGCFDEFNRLDEATLSAISMHIQPIQNAIKNHKSTVTLSDIEIDVNKFCGIFVTLNPAGGGYGGRNKLPDNLKQLFRPVIMTHPDHEQIARTLLHCDGYKNANSIGKKLIELFSLAEKLLSKQQHYDWGLRALRTVLSGCGRALKEFRKSHDEIGPEAEWKLVITAIRLDTLSKLTFSDSEIFDGLIKDVFPGVEFQQENNAKICSALEESFLELGMQKNERQMNKCLELYEQLKQRMGVAIVGPASSGKTTIRNVLIHALIKMGSVIKQHVFNPKCMQRNQLLGQIDVDTRQWTDGVLTKYSLEVTNEPLNVWSLIVSDGDIDPEWVESLNSVLDDNRLLSLPSGWRVQFGPNVNFIFETHDLSYASPATISRMGIVFLNESDVNIRDFVNNFLSKQPENVEMLLTNYVNDYFYKALDWIHNEAELIIEKPQIALASTALSQLVDCESKAQFVVGLINGLGGQIIEDFRDIFAQQIFEWTGESSPAVPTRAFYNRDRDLVDSYFTDQKQNVKDFQQDISLVLTAQVKHTIDVLRTWFHVGNEEHFLLVGPHGSAKTLILEYVVRELSETEIATIHCSAHVTPKYIIHKIIQNCLVVNSSKGRIYKPRRGNLVLYFKNLHLLKTDKWGTNMLIEFLQQLIVYKGFFDDTLDWVRIENITIVGSLEATNKLSSRFTSIVHIWNVDLPQHEDINIIFSTYLGGILKQCILNNPKIGKLTNTLLQIYNQMKDTFTQTDQQHYKFSPHDVTNWCKGILRYKLQTSDAETFLLEIISNEALRLFYDRLVSDEDRNKMIEIINNGIQMEWNKMNVVRNVLDNFYVASSQFNTNKLYTPLTKLNADDWSTIVNKGIIQYERDGFNLNIQIIPELLYLTANLSRALSAAGGNCVLVGSAGLGRRSALKIVSTLESSRLIVASTANENYFRNELKLAMQFSGVEGEQVYLLLEDHVMKGPILNILNILLSSGEVPGLYNAAEQESLIAGLKDEASRENFDGDLYKFFVERVRNKLHVIVCLEKDNDSFWKILESCPSLLQKCYLCWMNEWSTKTIQSIPNLLINKYNEKKDKEVQVEPCEGFEKILNSSIDSKLLTPIRYITMINMYIEIYTEKEKMIISKQKKLQAGVAKLNEAKNVVADLKVNAAEQQVKLSEKQGKANKALDMISNTMKNANVHKEEMETLKKQTEAENIQLVKRKKEIETELAEVEPLIQQARQAVGNIKNESLSEIRSLRAPPEVIRDILEGVLRLMGIQDTSWNSMKTFLAKRGVKEDIRSFDASRITPDNRQSVEKLVQNKSESFDPKSAKRASVAAAPLAAWVLANVRYSKVVEKIRPLEREQNKLQQNLTDAESQLSELSAGLLDVDATVAKLKGQLSTFTREAAELEIKLNAAEETLNSAKGLVEKLSDEYDRWQTQSKELDDDLKKLSTFSLLSSAFITYLSGEPENRRIIILKEWIESLGGNIEFSLETFLSSEREQMQWQSEGLSADRLSIQNAISTVKSKLCPFLIDPTSMAINWIKNKFKNTNLEYTTQDFAKFNISLELAIRFGKTLLIEEVETVSPILFAIFKKQFTYQGERVLINLNGKLIDYHKDFKLILSSRNSHLQLQADLLAILNMINFTTTNDGLTEQLLESAIRQESPELENRRKVLLKEREELQEKQYNLQNRLLEDLASSAGDILQNKNLLSSLEETKASSTAINSALIESNQVQTKLREEYNIYKDISKFGSSLYFAAANFAKKNVLYSISVSSFTTLFLMSLPSTEGLNTDNYSHKIMIQNLYNYMGRGIFKGDRLTFLMHLIHRMFPENIPITEWNFFLGNAIVGGKSQFDRSSLSWLPEQQLSQVLILQMTLPQVFNNLQLNDGNLWKSFMETGDAETNIPKHCKLSEFEKVITIQALRPDRLYSAMCHFVLQMTGIQNLNLDVMRLAQVYKETTSSQPILLITTSGNDPSLEIKELAANIVNSDKYTEISMGEGQESKAISMLNNSVQFGHWLTLKNLHLVTSWLPILCQHLQSMEPHPNFRLWLVTESHDNFSSVLAENSLKISYEAPAGIKSNLMKLYSTYGKEYLEKLNTNTSKFFFVLACVHAILQERRNYIPQGWSKWYEFSDLDFSTMVNLSEELWQSQIQWKYIIGWSIGAVYGGRIDKKQDLTVLESYLRQYFNDEVLSHRWKPLGLNQSLPSVPNYQDYINIINQLQNKDVPAYFGLPQNVDKSWEKNVSTQITQHLKSLHISTHISNKYTKEIFHKGLTPYISLWKKLNHEQEFLRLNPTQLQSASENSLIMFIQNEFQNAIILVQKIHRDFFILNKISKGFLTADEVDFDVAESLLNAQTPNKWLKLWEGPKEPSKYLKDIMKKILTISEWNKQQESYYNDNLNLAQLFNPETFLAAFKQYFARQTNIPIDELELKAIWKSRSNVISVSGLLIEGALFDGINLLQCSENSDTLNTTPICYITWEEKQTALNDSKYLDVPLYYTPSRERQVCSLQIPASIKEKSMWIQCGIAFYLGY